MTDQPGSGPTGDAPPPAPATPALPPPPAPVQAASAPAGATWGSGPTATPRPGRPKSTSGRTAITVLVLIVGVVFGANLVNAALPLPADPATVDPGPGAPARPEPQPGETLTPIRSLPPLEPGPVEAGDAIDVGAGFVLSPPDGWTVVGGEDGLTVLQKGNVLVIVGGFPWPDTPTALAETYRDAWFASGEFTGDQPGTGEIGDGIPAAVIGYTGVAESQAVDGAIVAGTAGGNGLVFNAFGATGSLAGVEDDLDRMLDTLGSTGG